MDSQHIASLVVAALARCGVPHMVVGSFARNFHAFARSTQDADIVLAVDTAALGRFEAELGPEFSLDPQATFETNTGTFRHTLMHVVDGAMFGVIATIFFPDALQAGLGLGVG